MSRLLTLVSAITLFALAGCGSSGGSAPGPDYGARHLGHGSASDVGPRDRQSTIRRQGSDKRLRPAASLQSPANVLVARDRTEPVVAVDPKRPWVVVAGSNTNYDAPVGGTLPPGYFTSHDGGRTFLHGNVPLVGGYTVGADPSVQIANDGTVFFGYLGESPSYCSEGGAAVEVAHSIDHGVSFRRPVIVDANPDDDKPTVSIRSVTGRQSHVYVSWNRDTNSSTSIWFARSTNGGASFTRPIRLHTSKVDNGSEPVAGPHNRLYVFWAVSGDTPPSSPSPTHIYMRRSTDDGAHFGPARPVSFLFWTVPNLLQPGSLRTLTEPSVVVDKSGTIYVAWAAAIRSYKGGAVDADILLTRSTNGGSTWTRPVRVNGVRHSDRFMPAVSVLSGGSVGVVWYDRRNHPWELDAYAARVTFGSRTRVSPNVRLNHTYASTSDILYIAPGSTCFSPGRFFGDYIGASSSGNQLYAIWADTQLHVPQETDIWLAKAKL